MGQHIHLGAIINPFDRYPTTVTLTDRERAAYYDDTTQKGVLPNGFPYSGPLDGYLNLFQQYMSSRAAPTAESTAAITAARQGILKSYPWLNPSDFSLVDLGNGMAEATLYGQSAGRGPLSVVVDVVASKLYSGAITRLPPPPPPPPATQPPPAPPPVTRPLPTYPPPVFVPRLPAPLLPEPTPEEKGGIPTWAWIVGAAVGLYLLTR